MDFCDEKKSELEDQLVLQEQETKRYHLIKLTHEYLTKAKERFTARYMEPISRGFAKYFKEVLSNKYICVVGNANKIDENSDLFDNTRDLIK